MMIRRLALALVLLILPVSPTMADGVLSLEGT